MMGGEIVDDRRVGGAESQDQGVVEYHLEGMAYRVASLSLTCIPFPEGAFFRTPLQGYT